MSSYRRVRTKQWLEQRGLLQSQIEARTPSEHRPIISSSQNTAKKAAQKMTRSLPNTAVVNRKTESTSTRSQNSGNEPRVLEAKKRGFADMIPLISQTADKKTSSMKIEENTTEGRRKCLQMMRCASVSFQSGHMLPSSSSTSEKVIFLPRSLSCFELIGCDTIDHKIYSDAPTPPVRAKQQVPLEPFRLLRAPRPPKRKALPNAEEELGVC